MLQSNEALPQLRTGSVVGWSAHCVAYNEIWKGTLALARAGAVCDFRQALPSEHHKLQNRQIIADIVRRRRYS